MAAKEGRLEMGWDLLEQGEFEGALRVAAAILEEEPEDPEAEFLAASARFESGDLAGAEAGLRALLSRESDDDPARVTLAAVFYETCRFDEGLRELQRVSPEGRSNPYALHLEGLLLDLTGRHGEADSRFAQAARLDPEGYPPPVVISRAAFEATVEEALAALPEEFLQKLGNLPILVEEVPSSALLATLEEPDPGLLGLFVGIPQTERSSGDLPASHEAIYLFKRNLERICSTRDDLREEIRVTLLHEVGHFLGMEEDDLEEAGYA